jgi:5'(3')-deoxyribonucleotidase
LIFGQNNMAYINYDSHLVERGTHSKGYFECRRRIAQQRAEAEAKLRKKQITQGYTIYCDLDDTLCDLSTPLFEAFGVKDTKELVSKYSRDEINEWFESLDMNFWQNLKWLPSGRKLWHVIKFYKPYIITAHHNFPGAATGKMQWVSKNLGVEYIGRLIMVDSSKNEYAKPNRILIDDFRKNCDGWVENGGIAIHHKVNDGQLTIASLKLCLKETTIIKHPYYSSYRFIRVGQPYKTGRPKGSGRYLKKAGRRKGVKNRRIKKPPFMRAVIKWQNGWADYKAKQEQKQQKHK